jgi:hypothetical protein
MLSLPAGMFPSQPYTIQLDLSQPSLKGVVGEESLTATVYHARGGEESVDDDNDGKLVGNAAHAAFIAPLFFAKKSDIDFGLRPFDCSELKGCSGHGNCVSDMPPRCGCEPGFKGDDCGVTDTTKASATTTPFSQPGATDAPIGGMGIKCNTVNGVDLYVDRCGVCGGKNACEAPGAGKTDEPGIVKPTDNGIDIFVFIAAGAGQSSSS